MTRRRDDANAPAGSTGSDGSGLGHDTAAGLVGAYLDEELPRDQALELAHHVAQCRACRQSLLVQRRVRDRLRGEATAPAPTALRDRIFTALDRRPTSRPRRRGMAGWAPLAALAASVAALLFMQTRDRIRHASPAAVAVRQSDSLAILSLIQAHAAAWNRRDAKAAAAVLTPDAVWVTSGGLELHGRDEIERAHVRWLAQDSAAGGSTHVHPPSSITIRFLRPDVAVADLDGQFIAPPVTPGGEGRLREEARIFVVATKNTGVWHIAQLRNLRREVRGSSPR
jgi:uncharacterized protein (TIGR02246 family)